MDKQIKIKKIKILNFKGIKRLESDFDEVLTNIVGDNGKGKTTVFDAFTWALFGKDSHDRKEFELKTLDNAGKTIYKLEHEVTVWLSCGNKDISVTRRLNERWSPEDVLLGHEEERLINDVPMSVKDFKEKIREYVCEEELFRLITSPTYFTSQTKDVQRNMLQSMIGEVEDVEKSETLACALMDKNIEELKKELAAKNRRLTEDIKTVNNKIEERNRDVVEELDWTALEEEKKRIEDEINVKESMLMDETKAFEELSKKKLDILNRVAELEMQYNKRRNEIVGAVTDKINEAVEKNRQSEIKMNAVKVRIDMNNKELKEYSREIDVLNEKITAKRKEWKETDAQRFNEQDYECVCPTCHRPYDVQQAAELIKDIRDRFNQSKAHDLKRIEEDGKKLAQQIKEYTELIESKTRDNNALEEEKKKYTMCLIPEDNSDELISKDEVLTELQQKINAEKENMRESAPQQDGQIKDALAALRQELAACMLQLAKRDDKAKKEKRLSELTLQLQTLSNELADNKLLEREAKAYSLARMQNMEDKINSMFKYVKFKLYEEQLNGEVVETCVATVDGVPYGRGLNTAGELNAGIDIINAISNRYGIHAPIFIDNAEGIGNIIDTKSQLVRLVFEKGKELTFEL